MDEHSLLRTLVADKRLDTELDERIVHRFAATVVEPAGLTELGVPLFKEGSIVLFVALAEKAKVVKGYLKSIAASDVNAIDTIDTLMRAAQSAGLQARKRPPVFEAPHLVDIFYGTETLARGVAPSMVGGVAVVVAAWNGGELDHAKFTVADYVRDAKAKPVSVHAVLTRPALTKLEQAVLKAVPADVDDLCVQGPALAWAAVARHGAPPTDNNGPLVDQVTKLDYNEVQQDAWTNQIERGVQQQENTQVQQEQVQVQQADHQYQDQFQAQVDQNNHVQQQQEQEQYFTKGQAQIQQQEDGETHQVQQQKVQTRQGRQEQEQHQGPADGWTDDDRNGASLNPFDRDGYLAVVAKTDFAALDTTQSAHALLRIRNEFVRRGMG